ncbi:cytochrome c oxidase assembly factor 1 homolog isoform X2 [Sagmatias obliquidens]|uniref:cytochrome c oxidase assembly factor 1 homolog isoform X2 n=1 Tax=Sagmatias obliquidens TaxID=3371155 RepID=UPI000F43F51B|nr:cytochrome c oxidase assembly factor 1 homolog isoform X2 [Lagenorhynchus obliquidens]
MRNFLQQAFFPSGFTQLQVSEMTGVFLLSVFWKVEKQMSLGSRMSMPLGKQLFFTGVAASGGCALLYYLLQKTFSRASYYQLALEHLHSHPEALEALGTPLNVHYLRLTDKYNFVDIADAKLKIPVSGPKSEGYLYVTSSRDAPFKRWNLQEVFLELKDGEQIPLFKPSGENSNELKKE